MHRSHDVSIWHGAWKYTSPGTSIQENRPKLSPESPPDSSAWQSVLPGAPSTWRVAQPHQRDHGDGSAGLLSGHHDSGSFPIHEARPLLSEIGRALCRERV